MSATNAKNKGAVFREESFASCPARVSGVSAFTFFPNRLGLLTVELSSFCKFLTSGSGTEVKWKRATIDTFFHGGITVT